MRSALCLPGLKAAVSRAVLMKMALSLVDGMTEDWNPSQYHDTYREDVLALVKRKIKAKQTKRMAPAIPEKRARATENVVDLVALLQQSLGGSKPPKKRRAANSWGGNPQGCRRIGGRSPATAP